MASQVVQLLYTAPRLTKFAAFLIVSEHMIARAIVDFIISDGDQQVIR